MNNKAPLLVSIFLIVFYSLSANATEVDLTRYGPQSFSHDLISPNIHRNAFFGVPGDASLVVTLEKMTVSKQLPGDVIINLNGTQVYRQSNTDSKLHKMEIPVTLIENNSIRVELFGDQGRDIKVRVRQHASIDLGIIGRIHFNINTANFKKSREFYRRLGFADAQGPFPETNSLEVSHGVGVKGLYKMYAELVFLGKLDEKSKNLLIPTGRYIDLIEWIEPHNEAPAYAHLYHLGITRVVFSTSNLNADMANMEEMGYSFLSVPATREDGSRFATMKDPDDVFVELREKKGAKPNLVNGSFVSEIRQLGINVSDFERSREFYKMLGFTKETRLEKTESLEVAKAMGLHKPYLVNGELIEHEIDNSKIELVEWQDPRDLSPPNPHPINHYGIQRINYATTDLEGDIAKLKAQGVRFLSPIAPCCSGKTSTFGFIAFMDPDGVFMQLLGPVTPSE